MAVDAQFFILQKTEFLATTNAGQTVVATRVELRPAAGDPLFGDNPNAYITMDIYDPAAAAQLLTGETYNLCLTPIEDAPEPTPLAP